MDVVVVVLEVTDLAGDRCGIWRGPGRGFADQFFRGSDHAGFVTLAELVEKSFQPGFGGAGSDPVQPRQRPEGVTGRDGNPGSSPRSRSDPGPGPRARPPRPSPDRPLGLAPTPYAGPRPARPPQTPGVRFPAGVATEYFSSNRPRPWAFSNR